MKRQVVVDIDGVIADEASPGEVYSREAGWPYEKCIVLPKGLELVYLVKSLGYTVCLHTARPMFEREKTEAWLKRNGVPFDSLVMGKPQGMLYVDDRGLRWDEKSEPEDAVKVLFREEGSVR